MFSFSWLEPCASGWERIFDKCYKFVSTTKSFSDAKSYCVTQGGILYEPRDLNVYNAIEQISPFAKGFGWLGVTDEAVEDTWRYATTGDLVPAKFLENGENEMWKDNEPNDLGGEDCVKSTVSRPIQWNDVRCSVTLPFICEKNAWL